MARRIFKPFTLGVFLVVLSFFFVPETAFAANGADVSRTGSSVPVSLAPGQTVGVRIRATNTGTTTWTSLANIRLGAGVSNNVTWSAWNCGGYSLSANNARAYMCSGSSVAPGGSYDFYFNVTAPSSGTAYLAVQMVQEGVAWFGDLETWSYSLATTNNANVTGSNAPSSMNLGQKVRVTVNVTNTGSTTWTAGTNYRLGALSTNGVTWSNFGCGGYANSATDARAYLCGNVAPGQSTSFSFDVTAPASGTSTRLAVQMVRDGVAWFGGQYTKTITLSGTPPSGGFVTASGAGFVCGGASYKAVGMNLRGTAYRGIPEIQEQINALNAMNVRVVRVFIAKSDRDSAGVRTALRDLINTTRAINPKIRFVVSLTDFYGGTGHTVQGDGGYYSSGLLTNKNGWYSSGFRTNYKPMVGALVAEFKNEPMIFAWELGNELSVGIDNTADSNTMLAFAYEMGNYIKAQGAQQMVTTGFLSSHHAAAGKYNGRTLAQLAAAFYQSWNGQTSPFAFVSIHGYNNEWATAGGNQTQADWAWAQSTKPYMVGEIGFGGAGGCDPYAGGSWDGITVAGTSSSRTSALTTTVNRFFDAKGADAVLQWGFMAGSDNGEGDQCYGLDNVWHTDWTGVRSYYINRQASLPGGGC